MLLELDRADVADSRMASFPVVEHFDVAEHVSLGVGAGAVDPAVRPLGLERLEEAFGCSVPQLPAILRNVGFRGFVWLQGLHNTLSNPMPLRSSA